MRQRDYQHRLQESGSGLYGSRSGWGSLHIDLPLLILLLGLAGAGLFVLYSASGGSTYYVKRQLIFLSVGLVGMLVVAQMPPRFLARWALLPYLFGLLLLVAVMLFGVGAKGAQRWLEVGGFRFQPSEVLKIAVPLLVASYLGRRSLPPRIKYIVVALAIAAIPTVLVASQPDLGTALLVMAAGVFVLFLAGLQKRYMFGALAAAAVAVPLMWVYGLRDYQKQRVLTLFDPYSDRLGAGWNIIQSTTAIGSGGTSGKGWMQGTQSQLDFLPESHTDFIIAVLAEEFGLVGVLALLGMYLLIVARCLLIAAGAQTMFSRLLAGSLTLTFFIYVFVNMAMVSGVLPVVGVPLPLVSYGGTSIVTLLLGFGILMAVATEKKRGV